MVSAIPSYLFTFECGRHFFFYGHPYHADKTCLVTMQENFPGNWKYKVWYCMGYLHVASGLRPDTALSVQSTLL